MMKKLHYVAFLILLAVPVLYTGSAIADDVQMDKLPAASVFSCLLCHDSATNPSPSNLNDFGVDFQDNGNLWNFELAAMDSDDDGCTNGAELGDIDGNGVLDVGVTKESSNPGVGDDCNSASNITDEITWGQLKELFNSR